MSSEKRKTELELLNDERQFMLNSQKQQQDAKQKELIKLRRKVADMEAYERNKAEMERQRIAHQEKTDAQQREADDLRKKILSMEQRKKQEAEEAKNSIANRKRPVNKPKKVAIDS